MNQGLSVPPKKETVGAATVATVRTTRWYERGGGLELPMVSIEVKLSAETPEELAGVIGGLVGDSEDEDGAKIQDAVLNLIEEINKMGMD